MTRDDQLRRLLPGYISLYMSGELARRVDNLEARLVSCDLCPRECGVNRLQGERGFCHSGHLPIVAAVCPHHGEEPALSGSRGSGTIFFGNCNLKCVYCQNYQISQGQQQSSEISFSTLAERMLYLQKLGCHNINLVSPSHFVPQLVRAVLEAVPLGLHLPLVYNTSSYDGITALKDLDDIISIYLADLRYASDGCAKKFSQAPNYVMYARKAIIEMYRQVGDLLLDDAGVAKRGLIVRHLVLPNKLSGSRESLTWLANEVSHKVYISVMSQYFPAHWAPQIPHLARTISLAEYTEVTKLLAELDLKNGWVQSMGVEEKFLPDFGAKAGPFLSVAESRK